MEHEKQVSNNVKSYNGNPPGMAFLMGEEVYQERWGSHAACGAGKRKLQALVVNS